MKLLRLIPIAVAALAVPATASAADVTGSDFSRLPVATPLTCADPCTVVSDHIGGSPVRLAGPSVVTGFRAAMGAGTVGKLRLLRRNGDGSFTDVAAGGLAWGDGTAKTHTVNVPLGAGDYAIGLDLLGGSVAAAPGAGTASMITPSLGYDRDTATGAARDGEVMLSVTAEPDRDADGLGDETQDTSVTTGSGTTGVGGGGGGGTGGGDVLPPPSTGDGVPGAGTGGGGSANGPTFGIEGKAILSAGAAGRQGWIRVYATWPGRGTLEGSLDVRYGKRSLGRNAIEVDAGGNDYWSFRLKPAERRLLLRKGSLKLRAVAALEYPDGRTGTVRRSITLLAGGATSAYDGVYRGPGPVQIVVERGVLTSINAPLNLFCSRSKRFMSRAFYGLGGFPALIGRDGSFSMKGSETSDTLTYYGKLRRGGVSTGYLSLFHTLIGLGSGGRVESEQCFAAKNWKVTRQR